VIIPSAFRRKFDVIAVWKLDRFGRSLRHLVNAIAEFEALGVAFISLRDNLDLGTPAGRLMFQIIGAMAEFERSLIQERLQEGARAAGRLPNRTRVVGQNRRSVNGSMEVYAIKVTLLGTSPSVWRRKLVPRDITLRNLHRTLQTVMGWTNSHLHQFVLAKTKAL